MTSPDASAGLLDLRIEGMIHDEAHRTCQLLIGKMRGTRRGGACRPWKMDESCHRAGRDSAQCGVEHVIAHVGTRRQRELCRQPVCGQDPDQVLDRKRREAGGGTIGFAGRIEGLGAVVVGDARVHQVHADALHRDLWTSAGEPGGDDGVGGVPVDQRAEASRGGFERDRQCRDDELVRTVVVGGDGVHGIGRGVARRAVEGLEAREKNDRHPSSVGASVQPTRILAA